MPSYSRDSSHREPIYVTIFLAQRSPERFGTVLQTSRTVRNGSAHLNFARRYFSTASKPPKKNGQEQFLLFRIFKTFQRAALWLQGPRLQGSQKNDKGEATSPPKSLNKQCKGMLSTREKVKLDVDYKRLEVSQLFVHGRRGPFQNLTCLENCSVESFLTKSYNCVVCIEISV